MLQLDLTSEDFFRDPRPQLRRLREAGPVVEVKLPLFGRVWMATTQEAASRVLKDSHNVQPAQTRWRCCRHTLVDAQGRSHAREQHADRG